MGADINLFYHGGAGGFYLFYQLLLTGEFDCMLDVKSKGVIAYEPSIAKRLIDEQYSASELEHWKKVEHWPDNDATLIMATSKRRLFMNASEEKEWLKYPGKTLYLYTDHKTQLRLASAKRAFYFGGDTPPDITYLKGKIRKTVDGLLPEVYLTKRKAEKMGGVTVKLQDLLRTQGLVDLFSDLDLPMSDKNEDFLKFYLRLHPKWFLNKLGLDHDIVAQGHD